MKRTCTRVRDEHDNRVGSLLHLPWASRGAWESAWEGRGRQQRGGRARVPANRAAQSYSRSSWKPTLLRASGSLSQAAQSSRGVIFSLNGISDPITTMHIITWPWLCVCLTAPHPPQCKEGKYETPLDWGPQAYAWSSFLRLFLINLNINFYSSCLCEVSTWKSSVTVTLGGHTWIILLKR